MAAEGNTGNAEALLTDDAALLDALRQGDEAAFVALVKRYHRPLIRLAQGYVRSEDVAEEVAQQAWQGLLESLDRFEIRASLKTWLYRILINCARARRRKERRSAPLSSLGPTDDDGPLVDPERFLPDGHPWAGHWSSAPRAFVLDDPAVSAEARQMLTEAILSLPENLREIITLRDVEGFSSDDACNALGVSDMNQRVLLHRARARVRTYLEERLGDGR